MNQCEMRTAWKGQMENIYRPGILWEQRTMSHRTGIKSAQAQQILLWNVDVDVRLCTKLNTLYTPLYVYSSIQSRVWPCCELCSSPYLLVCNVCNVLRSRSHHHYQEHWWHLAPVTPANTKNLQIQMCADLNICQEISDKAFDNNLICIMSSESTQRALREHSESTQRAFREESTQRLREHSLESYSWSL